MKSNDTSLMTCRKILGVRSGARATMAIYKQLFAGISDLFATLNISILSNRSVIKGYCLYVKIFQENNYYLKTKKWQ